MSLKDIYQVYPHLRRLEQLSEWKRAAFAASCCERLIPNYYAFFLIEHWGTPDALLTALNFVWKSIGHQGFDTAELALHLDECERSGPDADEFGTLLVGSAMDAAGAVYYALDSLRDVTPASAVNAGRSAIRTIESYLYGVNVPTLSLRAADDEFHRWLDQAPLLKAELRLQRQILETLTSPDCDLADEQSRDDLRRVSSDSGIQPIRRGIVTMDG